MTTDERVADAIVCCIDPSRHPSARALPPFPGATTETGVAILVDVGARPRPIALAETWHVRASPPPRLGKPTWQWGTEAFPLDAPMCIPDRIVADGLVALADGWAPRPQELGLLDVVLALIDLPTQSWRAMVLEHEAWIGLDREPRRWPSFVRVDLGEDSIVLTCFAAPPDSDRRFELGTLEDLEAARPEIVACMTRLHAWCEKFVEERLALERFADVLCVELGKANLPPFGGHWQVSRPSVDQFGARDRPTAWIAGASSTFCEDEQGRLVVDDIAYDPETPLSQLAEIVYAKAKSIFPLRAGEHYRLRRPLKGFLTNDVLLFRGAEDIRPNDTLYYSFESTTGRGGVEMLDGSRRFRGMSLSEVVADEDAVMRGMGDWFEWVEDELRPDVARARQAESLALVGKHLREHGELDAAERRLQEALALEPDHPLATFELGWIATQRDRWSDALDRFGRASTLDPSNLDARNNTAWALGRLGRWEEALAILDELATAKPSWTLVQRNRAWVLRSLGRLDDAQQACDGALALDPANAGVLEEARLIAAARGR